MAHSFVRELSLEKFFALGAVLETRETRETRKKPGTKKPGTETSIPDFAPFFRSKRNRELRSPSLVSLA
jgi:hypothetical protein